MTIQLLRPASPGGVDQFILRESFCGTYIASAQGRDTARRALWQVAKKVWLDLENYVAAAVGLAPPALYERFGSRPAGLSNPEAQTRLLTVGLNELAQELRPGFAKLLWRSAMNPLIILLAVLASVSFATGDVRSGSVMVLMIVLGVTLKLVQEAKSDGAAAKLKAMITVSATALRQGIQTDVPVAQLVPGDVIHLAAGDMIPADIRIVASKDLFVSQGPLTGESFPVAKFDTEKNPTSTNPLEFTCVAYLGTSVQSGSATALVVKTGSGTYLGGMAKSMTTAPAPTSFDRGLASFTKLIVRFVLVMVPLVFVINGFSKGSWSQAFFFAIAVAVGLTPEMLPMIVSVCLSKGAVAMSRKKVIVKRLNAIQNLGAMDILCTDKTGTLTMDRVLLERHCDVALRPSEAVLALAYVNSHFQTGLKSVLDQAILDHDGTSKVALLPEMVKIDEIPFDFDRRVMSVVVRTPEGKDRIVTKGAPEAIFSRCSASELDGRILPMDPQHIESLKREYERLSSDGFRVLAVASKDVEPREMGAGQHTLYGKTDEQDLILKGYVGFLDPPKETAGPAIKALANLGVSVKVITGDNDLVARKVCRDVGLALDSVLLGDAIEKLSDEELASAAEQTTLFARVTPAHKVRIIRALQSRKHTVGFMGDGINDAPALHVADVSVSVDTAVDIAKASADMILLEKSLMVLSEGVREGRKVFANILKYVRMGASSNFGNMFSVLGASVFVPFLPMLPIQILANNLLYDIGQTTIPTDDVDEDQIARPRPWDVKKLTRFILFIGPCSSLFDYSTFFVMLYVFKCWDVSTPAAASVSAGLFQTGWFIESLLTQTLVIHVIRTNRIPFLQSRASWPVIVLGLLTAGIGVAVPYSPLAGFFGFRPLPWLYWPIIAFTLTCYMVLTQQIKMWLLARNWI